MKYQLDQTIEWCERRWKVAAVMWLGERYYALVRSGVRPRPDAVSLIPEVVLERSGAQVYVPKRRPPKLNVVK